MKRVLLLFTLFLAAPLAAAHPVFSSHPKEMDGALDAISQLPEARPLLQQVQRDGKVSVSGSSRFGGQFSAFWDGGRREICIPNGAARGKGGQITSILFELHNARANGEIAALDRKAMRGQLSREAYVEGLERIEHRNAVEACALLKKGIQKGIFPADAYWEMPTSFDDYFRIQKRSGHSAWIARKYDAMCPLARS